MTRVIVVDDSAFFRSSITKVLTQDSEIEVIGVAKDGIEGLEKIKNLKPDVVTMDIEMPKLDGISTLKIIMDEMPLPVIMVSSLTKEGAEATLKALEFGAVDFIPKYPGNSLASMDLAALSSDLCTKVKAVAARAKRFPLKRIRKDKVPIISPVKKDFFTSPNHSERPRRDIIAIGVSTGGPPAVQKVLSELPETFPACILIAQHMPAAFTKPFAERLNSMCKISVKEAEHGNPIKNGIAYVCPGGRHLRLDLKGALPQIAVVSEPSTALYKPSANVLMESVGKSMGGRSVGVIMTGMGSDGVEGMRVLKSKGGFVIAQSEASCVVYGMPKAIVDGGLADEVVDLDNIAERVASALYK